MRIGLDIGTTNSCAAIFDGRAARMLELGEGTNTILPSVVTIVDKDILVGHEAIEAGRHHPDDCFRNFKRRLAERWHDDEDTGHQTVQGLDGFTHYKGTAVHTWSPQELTGFIAQTLTEAGNAKLNPQDEVTGAVIGVPADFTQSQRVAVMQAARLAGIENVELMHEPTAAALAYGFDAKKARRIAVFDLGGGTFDISIVQTGNGLVDVLATSGIRDLGGADWDRKIADHVCELWRLEHREQIDADEIVEHGQLDRAMPRILVEAERVKKQLTERDRVEFRVENATRTKDGVSLHIIQQIDRRVFDELTRDLRERAINACKMAIEDLRREDANFSVKDLHDILLVGGMTRVPSIRADVEAFFERAPRRSESPEHVVAMGCAIRAAILDGRKIDVTLADILSHAVGLETSNGFSAVLFEKGASYPCAETFTLTNEADDLTQLSIRLLEGDASKARGCDLIWATEVPVEEPGPAMTARHKLTVKIDAAGRIHASCDGQEYRGEAA